MRRPRSPRNEAGRGSSGMPSTPFVARGTRIDIAAGLVRALERNELVLHYQPEVDLRTGSLVGLEALVRWEHPERGLLPPSEFMPVAEESGIIGPLGGWVLSEATRQMAEWRATYPHMVEVGIAVNVSGRQLADPSCSNGSWPPSIFFPAGAPVRRGDRDGTARAPARRQHARAVQAQGRPARDRRLRHRLLVAVLCRPLGPRLPQGRPSASSADSAATPTTRRSSAR